MDDALARLNQMREEEGRGIERELRERMQHIQKAGRGVEQHRHAILQTYTRAIYSPACRNWSAPRSISERILQEAALLVDRSDIQEELVRLETHVKHFLGLLDQGGEVGKKLDFLLQEMNREANTLLSKTSGLAGEALKITEMGLAIKTRNRKIARAGAERRMSTVFIISAPSGSGKSTLGQRSSSIRRRPRFLHLLHHPLARAAASRTAANISSSPAPNSRT